MPATTFIGHFLGPDTHANRPAASGLPNGTLYVCSTHSKIERVVSGAWVDYATLGIPLGTGVVGADPIFDAKGDLPVGTGADTAARLAVGGDGQVLTADSAQATGAKWVTPPTVIASPLTLISTTTLSSAGTFDVSAISGAYTDLICIAIVRGTASAANDALLWNFNGDTAGNYGIQSMRGNTTTVSAAGAGASTGLNTGRAVAATGLANSYTVVEMTIYGYASTSWFKTSLWKAFDELTTTNSGADVDLGGVTWRNTAALTRIQLAATTAANLAAGSQLRIYGRT